MAKNKLLGKGGEKRLENVVYVITAMIQKRGSYLEKTWKRSCMHINTMAWDLQMFPML